MDISSLLSSLSQEDIEKLKNTAKQFFGDNETENNKKETEKSNMPFQLDPKMLTGVAKFSRMMNENDERCAFLLSLKPLLSEKRRKKADDAVQLLRFMRIINVLQESGNE